jgi:hypothetical protein
MPGEAARQAVGLHIQRRGGLVRHGVHKVVAVLAIIAIQPLASEGTCPSSRPFSLSSDRVSTAFPSQIINPDKRRALEYDLERFVSIHRKLRSKKGLDENHLHRPAIGIAYAGSSRIGCRPRHFEENGADRPQ